MYISKKYSKKPEKHVWRGLFRESCRIKYHSLLNVKYDRSFTRNLTKVLLTALKYKKVHGDIKGKFPFQTIAIELYKQQKNKQKKNA